MFKSIFMSNTNILGKMISDITGIDYELLEDNLILEANDLPVSRKNEKAKRCDFIARLDENMILNLELNKESYAELITKNLSYVFNIFSNITKRGEKYNENLNIIQINLNCFKDDLYYKNIPLIDFKLANIKYNLVLIDNLVVYAFNVVKCAEIYYNNFEKENIPNYIRWGALIYCCDFSEVPSIMEGILTKKECQILMDKLNSITKEDYFMTEEEALEWADWTENTIYDKGLKAGIKEGIQKNLENNIKNMLKKNISLEDISEITGKSIEEIKKYTN